MKSLHTALGSLFSELVNGPTGYAYMLNAGDLGLLRSLDRLSARAASQSNDHGASIAAHVDHLCFGLDLMNRWSSGEANPFTGADWTISWRTKSVSPAEWKALRGRLKQATRRWQRTLETPRPLPPMALNGVIGSVAHLAYHLGAIRQIQSATRGPRAD